MKAASAYRRSSAGPARCSLARWRTASSLGSTGSRRSSRRQVIRTLCTSYKVHLDGYDQNDLLSGKGPSKRHEIWYFAESKLGGLRLDEFKYRFIDQPEGWPGPKVPINMPILENIKQDPFERLPVSNLLEGSPAYFNDFYAREFLALRLCAAEGR